MAHPNAVLGCGHSKWCYIIKIKECSILPHPNVKVNLRLVLACSQSAVANLWSQCFLPAKALLETFLCAFTVLLAISF